MKCSLVTIKSYLFLYEQSVPTSIRKIVRHSMKNRLMRVNIVDFD